LVVTSSGPDWPLIAQIALDVGVGIGILLIGLGILLACSALAGLFHRINKTLDEVDRQISALSAPVAETLGHVGGIADTTDAAVARLTAVVGSLESVASGVAKTSDLVQRAVSPAIVNVGSTLTGVTAAVRRLVTGGHNDGGTSRGE
jgi:ABC-type transporter Mla subunit MlaD